MFRRRSVVQAVTNYLTSSRAVRSVAFEKRKHEREARGSVALMLYRAIFGIGRSMSQVVLDAEFHRLFKRPSEKMCHCETSVQML